MTVIGENDPGDGTTRYRQCKYMLIRALCDPWLRSHGQQMTQRHDYDSVGLDLTDEMKSRLEVLSAWSMVSDPRWKDVIERHLGPDKATQMELADACNVDRRTIPRWIDSGMDGIVSRVYKTR